MKRFLTFALLLALVCGLAHSTLADYVKRGTGKGGSNGKSAVPYNGPKAKPNPKVKTPSPQQPTTPNPPPVITRTPLAPPLPGKPAVTMPTIPSIKKAVPLTKQTGTLPKLGQQNQGSKLKLDKSLLPQGSGPQLSQSKAKLAKQDQSGELRQAWKIDFFGGNGNSFPGSNQNPGPFPPFHCGTPGSNNDNGHDGHGHGHNGHGGHGHGGHGHGGHGHDHDGHDHDGRPGINDGNPNAPTSPIRPGFVWVPASGNTPGHWERERAPVSAAPQARPGFVWVKGTATVPGHWERARAQ
jgi:hypothetical protein